MSLIPYYLLSIHDVNSPAQSAEGLLLTSRGGLMTDTLAGEVVYGSISTAGGGGRSYPVLIIVAVGVVSPFVNGAVAGVRNGVGVGAQILIPCHITVFTVTVQLVAEGTVPAIVRCSQPDSCGYIGILVSMIIAVVLQQQTVVPAYHVAAGSSDIKRTRYQCADHYDRRCRPAAYPSAGTGIRSADVSCKQAVPDL